MTRKRLNKRVLAMAAGAIIVLATAGTAIAFQQGLFEASDTPPDGSSVVATPTPLPSTTPTPTTPATGDPADTPAVREPAPKAETPASDSPATPLPQSRFAFVKNVTFGRPGTIVVDYAEYLTGAEAARAASARGDESPPPNDYYIVNDDQKTVTLKIAANASVRLASNPDGTSDPAGYPSDVERWANHFAAPSDENSGIRYAGYWIVVDNGTVTAVREQFAP